MRLNLAERTRPRPPATVGPSVNSVDGWRTGLAVSLTTLYTEEAARSRLERLHLDGRPALFSALAGEWDELSGRVEGLAKRRWTQRRRERQTWRHPLVAKASCEHVVWS
ncbi:MAG TPA: hypothetical protein VJZ50_07295, partial [Candidatus Limnocylindrales bacterium]|nr:hypothetical protein [Candidatus Limnocylindrales bacterium]